MALRLVRAIWGATLLFAPRRVLRPTEPRSAAAVAAIRVLGARHLAEVAILSGSERAEPPRWTVAVDLVHGMSMIAVAGCSRRFRRDALVSAGAAGLLAGWGELERRQAG